MNNWSEQGSLKPFKSLISVPGQKVCDHGQRVPPGVDRASETQMRDVPSWLAGCAEWLLGALSKGCCPPHVKHTWLQLTTSWSASTFYGVLMG